MKNLAFAAFLGLLVMFSCNTPPGKTGAVDPNATVVYQCPMDCENGKTYDKPGKCPICEMDLEQVTKPGKTPEKHDSMNHQH